MGLRAFVIPCAVLSVIGSASAEVVTLNSTKALTLYNGGKKTSDIRAWSYTAGTQAEQLAYSYKAWLTFDSSSLPRPYLQGATLDLTQTDDAITTDTAVTMDVYALTQSTGDSWNPATVTWTTAPGNVTTSSTAVDLAVATLVGSYTFQTQFPAMGEVIHIPFNAAGISFINGDTDGTSTFILAARNGSDHVTGFYGSTNAQLAVAIPEPTVIGGIAAASMGLMVRKREKVRKTRLVGQVA